MKDTSAGMMGRTEHPEFDTFRLIAADFRTEPLKEQ